MADIIQTIIGATIVAGLAIAIIIKGIIDKKKGKKSCSCGGNCGACNLCAPPQPNDNDKQN